MVDFTGLKIERNEIHFPNGEKVLFDYTVADCIIVNYWLIVRLEIPMNDNMVDNVYGLNVKTNQKWRIQSLPILMKHPYIAIVFDKTKGQLWAVDFYGIRVQIDISDGSIIKRDFVK
ncbi:hypothetical protein [Streptococcus ruminantium]|nr:hypothetical protein [Streptococcus ruminantium]